ncbi:SRPBCC domain-containing protein [Kitasatospora sp. NPDC057541]|uniref:SRPBCC domain-containing protein n=1 Tax=unclassified Kitasatospora TaxID=2633591 RepID=UPI0036BA67A5
MVADGIEREITIAAPRERVWEVLTRAEFLGAWFGAGAPARLDRLPGGPGDPGAAGDPGEPSALIERMEPPAVLVLRRSRPQHAAGGEYPAGPALVTFTLTTEPGNHTRLRLVESGPALRTRVIRTGTGWTRRLTEFACHTERLAHRR